MHNEWFKRINRALAWSFYSIFFLVPLAVFPTTYELFEFNKMWITYGATLLVLFLWVAKIVLNGTLIIKRTPLDIPIILFLASQIISTIFSLDPYVSFWGYYSRFNGGLLSTICYIFLYFAFASNCLTEDRKPESAKFKPNLKIDKILPTVSHKLIGVSLLSGTIVALWGLPAHFGYDPTCLIFRGTLDVSCWTDAFQPKVRLFSTLGQPNWLAAYIGILIPISIAFWLNVKNDSSKIWYLVFGILSILLYIELLWTRSQSGFIAFWIAAFTFLVLLGHEVEGKKFRFKLLLKNEFIKLSVVLFATFAVISFFIGVPVGFLEKYTLPFLLAPDNNSSKSQTIEKPVIEELGGSDSGKIRLIVWQGAIDIFKRYPLIGSGVETFAFAYYQVKPLAHNLTSEWDYLYNKAHNEYLNYLATTGAFGLGSYLLLIGWFLFTALKYLNSKHEAQTKRFENLDFKHLNLFRILPVGRQVSDFGFRILPIALIASYISILISNFFGFSVVIVNLYFFLIPLFLFEALGIMSKYSNLTLKIYSPKNSSVTKVGIVITGLAILYMEFLLVRFWVADQKYALGYNLNKVAEYIQAYPNLEEAVMISPNEDLYKDELSMNLAVLALGLNQQEKATQASELAQRAIYLSDEVVKNHPNNVVYYKTRTRVMFVLSEIDNLYMDGAILAIENAARLAPTDPKIYYNMALLKKEDNITDAIKALKKAIELKPNYRDAYFALATYLKEQADVVEKTDYNFAQEIKKEAIKYLRYSLNNIEPNDEQALDLLKTLQ